MVLVMMTSPIQVAVATDFAQDSHGVNCQMPDSITKLAVAMNCGSDHSGSDHSKNCQEHPGCIAHMSSSLLPSGFVVADSRVELQVKFKAGHESILSHYPSLLKRPPKSS